MPTDSPSATQPPLLDFTPVRFKRTRHDGWTPDKQRRLIAAIAETGSISAAARAVGASHASAYDLYHHPDGASFRAAWDRALACGVSRIHDIAMERATTGTPVPVFYRGEQIGEQVRFSDRVLVHLLRHHAFGDHPSPVGRWSKAALERHAAENCPSCRDRREAEERAASEGPTVDECAEVMERELIARYALKVASERHYRLTGRIVGADYCARQLAWLELVMDHAGLASTLLAFWQGDLRAMLDIRPTETAAKLAAIREGVWAEAGHPPRPEVLHTDSAHGVSLRCGPTTLEREKAQKAAEARMAAAQAEWEAAATEEGWAAWRAPQ